MTHTSTAAAARDDVGDLYQRRLMRIVVGAVLTSTAAAAPVLGLLGTPPRLVLIVGAGVAVIAALIVRALPPPLHFYGQRLSLWLPVVGVGLVAPLTMHALLSLVLPIDDDVFTNWCMLSVVTTAHIHLVFIALATRSVMRCFRGTSSMSTLHIWQWTTMSALLPTGFILVSRDLWQTAMFAVTALTVALVGVMGPAFMWPLMNTLRCAADAERARTQT
jgi:hypothetical protein